MERCFKIKEGSSQWVECLLYKENAKRANVLFGEFKKEFGIESNLYSPGPLLIYIEPTSSDLEKFKDVLSTVSRNGLRPFKVNRKPGKWWKRKMEEAGIRDTSKPYVPFWFCDGACSSWTKLFEFDDIWYCSIKTDAEVKTPEGMQEISRSEMYKIIEILEERRAEQAKEE